MVWKVVLQPHMTEREQRALSANLQSWSLCFAAVERLEKIYSRIPWRLKARMPTLGGRRHDAIVLKGRVVVTVKQKMTECDPQKCRKPFMRHDLQNIIMLVYSSKPIAFRREKVNTGRESITRRIIPLKGGVR